MTWRNWAIAASGLAHVLALASAPAPRCSDLPSAGEVIKKVIERAKQDSQENQTRYVYTLRNVVEELDERGTLKERRERLYQTVIIDGERYNRLVAKDGKPLSSEDQKREQEREQKFRKTAAERKRKKREGDDDQIALNEELFSRYKIEIVDREPVNGRAALVATFEPKRSDLPARRRIDFLLNKLAGKVWIDEQDYEIANAQIRLTGPATKFGGILASVRKFDALYEQTRLDDGQWAPHRLENYFAGRIVFKSLYQKTTQEWSDFKRVN